MMLFVYDRFSWIITAFRTGLVPAGQLGGDKKLLFMDDTQEVEGLTETTPSTWGGGRRGIFVVTAVSLRTNRRCHRLGLPTKLGSRVVECCSFTVCTLWHASPWYSL